MLPAFSGLSQTLALTLLYLLHQQYVKIVRMCCLIAAPFTPTCTLGSVNLILLDSFHTEKKRIFILS